MLIALSEVCAPTLLFSFHVIMFMLVPVTAGSQLAAVGEGEAGRSFAPCSPVDALTFTLSQRCCAAPVGTLLICRLDQR